MGCISSKFISQSICFQEGKKNLSSHNRKTNGTAVLDEVISDHFLALVCTANMVANKLQSRNFTSDTCPILPTEPVNTETISTSELIRSLDQGVVKEAEPPAEVVESIEVDLTRRRSKSCHWFPEHDEVSSLALESSDGIKSSWRSYHTVEEYDALVENILFRRSKSSSNISHDIEDRESVLQEMKQSCFQDKTMLEETGICFSSSSGEDNQEPIPSPLCSSSTKESHIFEKGFKRKAIAKELESLRIPPAIEFPAILSHGEWIQVGGQVYSLGSCVTPKFGSYSLPISGNVNECSDGFIFNPELVSAFEQCMHQLEAEEESILKQIEEDKHQGETSQR